MWEAWGKGDRKGAVSAIPDRVIGELIQRGSMADIRARVQRYFDAGLDTAYLSLTTLEPDPERKRAILREAVRALAPGAR